MKKLTLNQESLKTLRTLLEKQRREILQHGKTLQIDFRVNDDEKKDEVDLALHDVEQGMTMRMGNRESLYFKKVEEALLRMNEGTYGKCLECAGEIGLKRLGARPTAELCIDCKEAAERRENLNADGKKPKSLGEVVSFKTT